MDTPTFQNADEVWGYRSIERTIGDFLGIASSSDLGVRASGTLDEAGHFGYTAMIGDGTGQRPENNRQKRFYFASPLKASTAIVEPYIDYEDGLKRYPKDSALWFRDLLVGKHGGF